MYGQKHEIYVHINLYNINLAADKYFKIFLLPKKKKEVIKEENSQNSK